MAFRQKKGCAFLFYFRMNQNGNVACKKIGLKGKWVKMNAYWWLITLGSLLAVFLCIQYGEYRVVFKAEEWENWLTYETKIFNKQFCNMTCELSTYSQKRLSLLNITWRGNVLEDTEKPKDLGVVLDTSLIYKHRFIKTRNKWCPEIPSLLVNEFLSFWTQVCVFHLLTKEAKPSEYHMDWERIGRHRKNQDILELSWPHPSYTKTISLKQGKNYVQK